jgi:hypothetical protein
LRSLLRPVLLPALAAVALSACGGGEGDPPAKPLADEYGRCADLAKSVSAATWLDPNNTSGVGCAIPAARPLCLSGITVSVIDRFDETCDGKSFGTYYVQDSSPNPPAAYGGILVFRPSFSPPDLRLAEGDVVDFLGSLTEFPGPSTFKFPGCRTEPELSGALTFRFDGNVALVPKEIDAFDLASYETGRPLLGQLVKATKTKGADGVKIDMNGGGSSGKCSRYTAGIDVGAIGDVGDLPHITNELYDIDTAGPMLGGNKTLKSVTGIVTYFAGYHIAPRSPADFEM